MKQAASLTGSPLAALKAAKAAGCPAFRGSRVALAELKSWLTANPSIAKAKDTTWKTKIDREKHRKLKLENDEKEGTLISRASMAESIHAAAGRVDGFRHKSEAEHPLLFAAAANDVPACREVVKKIWDEVMASMKTLGEQFDERKAPRV